MANRFDQIFRFLADTRNLERGTGRVEKKASGLQRTFGNLGGKIAVAFGGAAAVGFAKQTVGLAIAADEAASKFDTVFESATGASEKMQAFADKAGVATAKSQDLFATLGNLTTAQGFSADASLDFASKVGDLAGDLASFNDADPAEVFRELGFAMTTTERESLKKYGIAIMEAEVQTRALELATEDGRDEVTKADRALATYQLTVEQAGKAVGDLDRTSDSMANRLRRLNARVEDAKVAFGEELVPAIEDLLPLVEDAIPLLGGLASTLGRATTNVTGFSGAISPMESDIKDTGSALDRASDLLGGFAGLLSRTPLVVTPLQERFGRLQDSLHELGETMRIELDEAVSTYVPRQNELQDAIGGTVDKLGEAADQAGTTQGALEQMGQFAYDDLLAYNRELGKTIDLLSLSEEAARRFFRDREGVFRRRTGSLPELREQRAAGNVQPVQDAVREEERNQGLTQ